MGGAFGGKLNNASWIACICSVVAKKLNRPTYGYLSREEDLAITGKRHGVYTKYRLVRNKRGFLAPILIKIGQASFI